MNVFAAFRPRSPAFDFETLFDSAPISEAQKKHMARVYSTLALTALVTFVTVAFDGPWALVHPALGLALAAAALLYVFLAAKSSSGFDARRTLALGVLAMSLGIMDRNYVRMAFAVNPELVNTALMATVGIFSSFTLAALFISRRTHMYVVASVLSLSAYIFLADLANLLFRSRFVNTTTLFLGVLVLVGHVVVDTQKVLRKVELGRQDHISDAIMLYYDLFALFFQILTYSLEKDARKDRKKPKGRD